MESLLIYFSTFDPVTNEDFSLATSCAFEHHADVVFVPIASGGIAPIENRLAMLKLAYKESGSASVFIDDHFAKKNEDDFLTIVSSWAKKAKGRKIYVYFHPSVLEASKKRWGPLSHSATLLYSTRPSYCPEEKDIQAFKMERLPLSVGDASKAVRTLHSSAIPAKVRDYIEKNSLYYIQEIADILQSEHRLAHVISVANLAYEIARLNHREEAEVAYAAGLLHDLGKHTPKEEAKAIMERDYPQYASLPAWAYHQFVGATLAQEKFHVSDARILDAICFHATGRAHMPPLSKIIYAADKIEPLRGYDSRKMIALCKKNYYVGFLKVLKENRIFLESVGCKLDNPLTQECMNLYLGEEE